MYDLPLSAGNCWETQCEWRASSETDSAEHPAVGSSAGAGDRVRGRPIAGDASDETYRRCRGVRRRSGGCRAGEGASPSNSAPRFRPRASGELRVAARPLALPLRPHTVPTPPSYSYSSLELPRRAAQTIPACPPRSHDLRLVRDQPRLPYLPDAAATDLESGQPRAHRSNNGDCAVSDGRIRPDGVVHLDLLYQRHPRTTRCVDRRSGSVAAFLHPLSARVDRDQARLRRRRLRRLYRRHPVDPPPDRQDPAPRHQRLPRTTALGRRETCASYHTLQIKSVWRRSDPAQGSRSSPSRESATPTIRIPCKNGSGS